MGITIIDLIETAVNKAWMAETSSDPDNWTRENPAWGQCAVTAVVVNDYRGGRIIWSEALLPDGRKISHYFNIIKNGSEVDFTRSQFPEGTVIPAGVDKTKGFPTTRDYVLSDEMTKKRYQILRQSVESIL